MRTLPKTRDRPARPTQIPELAQAIATPRGSPISGGGAARQACRRAREIIAALSLLQRLFRPADDRAPLRPLYAAIVREARQPAWYGEGGVPDTLDGRFDMVAAVLAAVLLRLEGPDAADGARQSALLTEIFVEDMDGQLRQMGFGDIVVGKHVGRMMAALGGRIGAYRAAFAGEAGLADALLRNVYRGQDPGAARLAATAARFAALHAALAHSPAETVLAGRMPQP
jgi:cytochrome b pre-mRNA-processing protein 3